MKLAIAHGCTSVAFPLISSGLHGYPKDRVLRHAAEVINEFLEENELDVYIVVYDKASYSISRELFLDVTAYIDNFYIEHVRASESAAPPSFSKMPPIARRNYEARRRAPVVDDVEIFSDANDGVAVSALSYFSEQTQDVLENMFSKMDRGFAETLFYYIDKKGISDVECYKRSNVGKKTFSKIKCSKDYRPSKITAVSFAVGLHLDIEQTRHLLSTAGMCLSRSNKFDVIIEYFITTGNYETIFDVNEVLYQFDQSLLGV